MSTPLWQRAVVGAQARANPVLRRAVDHPDVAAALALGQSLRRGAVSVVEAPTRRALHLLNLPAASDVNRLLVQIAALQREVRDLRKQLDDSHPAGEGPYA